MKPAAKGKMRAFTLIELLVIIAVLLILAALLMPATTGPRKSLHAMCLNNQKQIALGFIMWQGDNDGKFPWQLSDTNGGSMDAAARGYAAPNFQVLSNYLKRPEVLVCPTDKARNITSNLTQLSNEHLSYFIASDQGSLASASILSGDRHLENTGKPVQRGLFNYSTNLTMNWTHELHYNPNSTSGNLSFADGHVERMIGTRLNSVFQHEGLATNHLAVP